MAQLAMLFTATAAAGTACDSTPIAGGPDPLPPGVLDRLAAERDSVVVGDHLRIRALGHDGTELDPERLRWASSDPGVASLSALGDLAALTPGLAEVRAASTGDTAMLLIVVQKPPVVARIVPQDTSVHVGGQIRFVGWFYDEDGRPVSGPSHWWVSDSTRLALTTRGYATARAPGSVQVVVSRDSLADTARILVLQVGAAVSVTILPDSQAFLVGEAIRMVADARDDAGARVYRTPTWTISDTTIATIGTTGILTARALGEVTVSAMLDGVTGTTPLRVTDRPLRFSAVAGGGEFSCGLESDGASFCWGRGNTGQLGRVVPLQCASDYAPYFVECSPRPVRVQTDVRFARLFAGPWHACGLDPEGAAWCWGDNRWTQLGSGDGATHWTPVPVNTTLRFRSLSPSYYHTCGVALDGALYCWGAPIWAQVPPGDWTSPIPVAPERRFTAVAAGVDHTCAIATDGTTWCWGREGALGGPADSTCYWSGPEPCASGPLLVPTDEQFVQISANTRNTCALTGAGRAYCWGWNDYGQVGDGSESSREAPTPVAGDYRFAELTVGFQYVCGRTLSDGMLCWGRNAGTFGDGRGLELVNPLPVPGAFGVTATGVSAGFEHTCAVTAGGAGYCWGRNWQGQVGNGQHGLTARLLLPAEVRGAR